MFKSVNFIISNIPINVICYQVDVATVIQTVQPDIVVLELCKDRTNILHLDEETVLEEAKNLTMDKMLLAIRQNGTIQVI